MHSTLVLLASTATLTLGPAEARAENGALEPILDLAWSAPPECPDGAHVKARVVELVGHTHATRTLSARGDVTKSPDGARYRLALAVGRAPVTDRSMDDADCGRLAEAAALILALDVDAAARELEQPPIATAEHPDAALSRPARASPRPGKHTAKQKAITVDVGARALLDEGSLPRATAGIAVVATVARGSVAFDAHAAAYEQRFTGGPREGAGGAYVDLATAGVRGCMRRLSETTGVYACAGGELGRIGTRGVGIAQPSTSAALWGAASLSIEARPFQDRMVSPVFGLFVGHPLAAPDVVIVGFGTLFEPPIFFFRAQLGLQVRVF